MFVYLDTKLYKDLIAQSKMKSKIKALYSNGQVTLFFVSLVKTIGLRNAIHTQIIN